MVGLVTAGAWAQLAAVPTSWLAAVPDQVSDTQAATLPTAGLTALVSLEVAGLVLAKRVLVTGATGGVGRIAVQLARASGAHVSALVRAAAAAALLGRLGAGAVVERLEGDDDLIVDGVGAIFGQAIEHLSPHGVVVNLATPSRRRRSASARPGRPVARGEDLHPHPVPRARLARRRDQGSGAAVRAGRRRTPPRPGRAGGLLACAHSSPGRPPAAPHRRQGRPPHRLRARPSLGAAQQGGPGCRVAATWGSRRAAFG